MPASVRDTGDDIIVVGAGPCAAMAAHELIAAGQRVTMLDAGPRAPRGLIVKVAGRTLLRLGESRFMTHNRPSAEVRNGAMWGSSLSLGGLTNYWTGAVPRYAPDDFTDAATVDERFDWPLRYADLAPFYDSVESLLDITGDAPFPNVPAGIVRHTWTPPRDWRGLAERLAAGGDALGALPIAKGPPSMVALRPREFTSYHAIIRRLLPDPRFRLVTSTRVLRVDYSPARSAATGVSAIDTSTGSVKKWPARAVVLAAGVLDTTEILLRSTSSDFPNGLGNAHSVLGRYLHDHPKDWWPARLTSAMTALPHGMYMSREAYDPDQPMAGASLTLGLAHPFDRALALAGRKSRRIGVQVFGTMEPRDDVSVSLRNDVADDDPASGLVVDIRFAGRDIATIERARARFVRAFDAAGNAAEIGPFGELVPGASYHLGGTARMHARPEFGVVDGHNRVHGVPNVIVADASALTTGPEKNPTLTTMALAARAARLLAQV